MNKSTMNILFIGTAIKLNQQMLSAYCKLISEITVLLNRLFHLFNDLIICQILFISHKSFQIVQTTPHRQHSLYSKSKFRHLTLIADKLNPITLEQ